MPRGTRSARTRASSVKYKQQSILSHFSSSPPPNATNKTSYSSLSQVGKSKAKRMHDVEADVEVPESSRIRITTQRSRPPSVSVEEDSDSSDVGKIKFETRSSSARGNTTGQSGSEATTSSPKRLVKRRRIFNSDTEMSESDLVRKGTSQRLGKRSQQEENGPQSDSDAPQKGKGRLVRGRRPSPHREEDEDNILDGIDEDKIIDSRLRGPRTQRSRFMQNLERLKRKKRGSRASESDEQTSEDDDIIPGARPDKGGDESEASQSQDNQASESEERIGDFIVDDEGDAQTATLPAMFSMNTHQDLVHHFKIVCQYLVHLAVTSPAARSRIAERLTSDEYFSVPLSITRRKVADIRDSIVSSVWRPVYKKALLTYPDFNLHDLDFAVPQCDACNLGGRLSKFVGRLGGYPYDRTTFQPKNTDPRSSSNESDSESKNRAPEFNLGRFCAQRTDIFHELCHWEFKLFCELSREVEDLSHVGRGFVKTAYAGGAAPPDDVSDADQVMEWLDQRGIINAEWLKVKQLMSRATNLEADVKRGKEDD